MTDEERQRADFDKFWEESKDMFPPGMTEEAKQRAEETCKTYLSTMGVHLVVHKDRDEKGDDVMPEVKSLEDLSEEEVNKILGAHTSMSREEAIDAIRDSVQRDTHVKMEELRKFPEVLRNRFHQMTPAQLSNFIDGMRSLAKSGKGNGPWYETFLALALKEFKRRQCAIHADYATDNYRVGDYANLGMGGFRMGPRLYRIVYGVRGNPIDDAYDLRDQLVKILPAFRSVCEALQIHWCLEFGQFMDSHVHWAPVTTDWLLIPIPPYSEPVWDVMPCLDDDENYLHALGCPLHISTDGAKYLHWDNLREPAIIGKWTPYATNGSHLELYLVNYDSCFDRFLPYGMPYKPCRFFTVREPLPDIVVDLVDRRVGNDSSKPSGTMLQTIVHQTMRKWWLSPAWEKEKTRVEFRFGENGKVTASIAAGGNHDVRNEFARGADMIVDFTRNDLYGGIYRVYETPPNESSKLTLPKRPAESEENDMAKKRTQTEGVDLKDSINKVDAADQMTGIQITPPDDAERVTEVVEDENANVSSMREVWKYPLQTSPEAGYKISGVRAVRHYIGRINRNQGIDEIRANLAYMMGYRNEENCGGFEAEVSNDFWMEEAAKCIAYGAVDYTDTPDDWAMFLPTVDVFRKDIHRHPMKYGASNFQASTPGMYFTFKNPGECDVFWVRYYVAHRFKLESYSILAETANDLQEVLRQLFIEYGSSDAPKLAEAMTEKVVRMEHPDEMDLVVAFDDFHVMNHIDAALRENTQRFVDYRDNSQNIAVIRRIDRSNEESKDPDTFQFQVVVLPARYNVPRVRLEDEDDHASAEAAGDKETKLFEELNRVLAETNKLVQQFLSSKCDVGSDRLNAEEKPRYFIEDAGLTEMMERAAEFMASCPDFRDDPETITITGMPGKAELVSEWTTAEPNETWLSPEGFVELIMKRSGDAVRKLDLHNCEHAFRDIMGTHGHKLMAGANADVSGVHIFWTIEDPQYVTYPQCHVYSEAPLDVFDHPAYVIDGCQDADGIKYYRLYHVDYEMDRTHARGAVRNVSYHSNIKHAISAVMSGIAIFYPNKKCSPYALPKKKVREVLKNYGKMARYARFRTHIAIHLEHAENGVYINELNAYYKKKMSLFLDQDPYAITVDYKTINGTRCYVVGTPTPKQADDFINGRM